jgi:hypothetical protein
MTRFALQTGHNPCAPLASISEAIRAGERPVASSSPAIPRIDAELAHARAAMASAELASAQLGLDAEAASEAAKAAHAHVQACIGDVVRAEADVLADRLAAARATEADLTEKIGEHGSFLARLVNPPAGSPLARGMANNWLFNGPEHRRSMAYAVRWQEFAEALAEDADAELNLN